MNLFFNDEIIVDARNLNSSSGIYHSTFVLAGSLNMYTGQCTVSITGQAYDPYVFCSTLSSTLNFRPLANFVY